MSVSLLRWVGNIHLADRCSFKGLAPSRRWSPSADAPPRLLSDPVIRLACLGESEFVGGVPFAKRWFGDTFEGNAIPFHGCENCDDFPPPSESVDVAIVGGGLSGLATAYQLRDRNTVLFELRPRMGGNAMGEAYGDQSWSLASAYFMQAKRGGPLATLYDELGLPAQWRQDSGGFSFEYDGVVGSDLLGPDPSPADKRALAAYREAVLGFAGRDYPEIPFEGRANAIITELDGRSFRGDLELRCGTLPPRLAYLLQAYCYSSLGVGFDELSAAAGWNFVAAEEFGRNVLPSGNAGLAQALWNQARARVRMRAGCTVANVVLSRPLARDFYDLYLGGGRAFPMDDNAFEQHRVITDAVNAGFATSPAPARSRSTGRFPGTPRDSASSTKKTGAPTPSWPRRRSSPSSGTLDSYRAMSPKCGSRVGATRCRSLVPAPFPAGSRKNSAARSVIAFGSPTKTTGCFPRWRPVSPKQCGFRRRCNQRSDELQLPEFSSLRGRRTRPPCGKSGQRWP